MNFGKLFEELTKDQQEEAKRCVTPKDLKDFFKRNNIVLTEEYLTKVGGGLKADMGMAKSGSGYCPYTIDRTCKLGCGFDNDNEDCRYCGWRAW